MMRRMEAAVGPTATVSLQPLWRLTTCADAGYLRRRRWLLGRSPLLMQVGDHNTVATWCTTATPQRYFFASWQASNTTADVASAATTITSTSTPTPPPSCASQNSNASTSTAGSATAELQQLKLQIRDLKEALEDSRRTVQQLLQLKTGRGDIRGDLAAGLSDSASASRVASARTETPATRENGACYVVRTSPELFDALRGRGSESASRTIILEGSLFVLDWYTQVIVDRAKVTLIGNGATIIGHLAVRGRGAVLSISDAFLFAPGTASLQQGGGGGANTSLPLPRAPPPLEGMSVMPLLPVLSATISAGLHLTRCTISNGRDGVYLGMASHATLSDVTIINCTRGLYEGVGCRTSLLASCRFAQNRYHVVLLGEDSRERASLLGCYPPSKAPVEEGSPKAKIAESSKTGSCKYSVKFTTVASMEEISPPDFHCTSPPLTLQENKAQVVLQHDPIADIYDDCWSDGVHLELSEEDRTAGLSDPVY